MAPQCRETYSTVPYLVQHTSFMDTYTKVLLSKFIVWTNATERTTIGTRQNNMAQAMQATITRQDKSRHLAFRGQIHPIYYC